VVSKHLNIFVVEDEALIRMMVVEMLEELGHTIAAEAGHLDKALELAGSVDFDLAVLDVIVAVVGQAVILVGDLRPSRPPPGGGMITAAAVMKAGAIEFPAGP
jgi:CheY-like chemotaxis protein